MPATRSAKDDGADDVTRGPTIEVQDGVFLRRAGPESAPALWCVHGFGESGFSFEPLTKTPLCDAYRLFVPDLPGFGVSPPTSEAATLDGQAACLVSLIETLTPDQPIGLIGHSLGSAIAVLTAGALKSPVAGLFAIEGNLTAAGGYFTGRAAKFGDATKFKSVFLADVAERASEDQALRRYLASVTLADEETFWRLGRDASTRAQDDGLGELYRGLACPSLFYWGAASTVAEDRAYIKAHDLPNRTYEDAGHWPMVDIPDATGRAIAGFFDQPAFKGGA